MADSLENLIRKYLDGAATPEEIKRVEDYYNSFSGAENYTGKLSPDEKKVLEEKILYSISRRLAQPRKSHDKQRRLVHISILKVAAVVAGLVAISLIYLTMQPGQRTRIETAYGEMREYVLPDHSVVILNGNSSIEFSSWNEDEPRLVSLTGEAYFSVVHTHNHSKFVVNVPGKFQVEVLGTEFNVTSRQRTASVVLNSGKVRINGLLADSTITLKPGERIALDSSRENIVKAIVDAEKYVSWKDQKLIFDDTPLKEIVATLEETYGYTVTVEDKALLDETFTGTIPGNDINMLVLGLNKIGHNVTMRGNEIHMKKR